MIPRCLKCGEAHQTKKIAPYNASRQHTVLISKLTAIWPTTQKCPLFPKPRKGKTTKNNYTTVVDSIVRPNITYAQATNNKKSVQYKTLNRWHHE
ncbi:hypothetical protein TNCV_4805791 [Trichonephila clavipes]|nr:hypothetical protein TNCV_4805791 [Trichonephila clavipes]